MLAYPLTSVPLTFAHIDGLKTSTDKSTLFSKLEVRVRIIKDAPRNIDACIVDGIFLVHSYADLPLAFGGQSNVTLSCLVRRANHTGAQLRHNDFRIFADRSSRNNSENGKKLVIYLAVL